MITYFIRDGLHRVATIADAPWKARATEGGDFFELELLECRYGTDHPTYRRRLLIHAPSEAWLQQAARLCLLYGGVDVAMEGVGDRKFQRITTCKALGLAEAPGRTDGRLATDGCAFNPSWRGNAPDGFRLVAGGVNDISRRGGRLAYRGKTWTLHVLNGRGPVSEHLGMANYSFDEIELRRLGAIAAPTIRNRLRAADHVAFDKHAPFLSAADLTDALAAFPPRGFRRAA